METGIRLIAQHYDIATGDKKKEASRFMRFMLLFDRFQTLFFPNPYPMND